MSKSAKILISLALAIGGFLSMGIGFAAHIPHPYNTILFLPGFTFIRLESSCPFLLPFQKEELLSEDYNGRNS
jgi:hypothetical protein